MHLCGKGFKPFVGVKCIDLDFWVGFHKIRVVGKAHIDNTVVLGKGGFYIGIYKFFIIFNLVNLENNIIAHLQIIEYLIQAVHPCANAWIRCHIVLVLFFVLNGTNLFITIQHVSY